MCGLTDRTIVKGYKIQCYHFLTPFICGLYITHTYAPINKTVNHTQVPFFFPPFLFISLLQPFS